MPVTVCIRPKKMIEIRDLDKTKFNIYCVISSTSSKVDKEKMIL